MTMKVLLAGILGGVVLFVWGAVAHMALPLGEIGLQSLPNDEVLMLAMRAGIPQSGLYFFPSYDFRKDLPKEQLEAAEKAWVEKYRRGPSGLLVYSTGGGDPMSPKQLGGELGSNIVAALVAAILLCMAAGSLPGYGQRVLFVMLVGIVGGLDVQTSYSVWYGFPWSYTTATLVTQLLGFLFAGLAMARIFRPQQAP